ncbi:MAG: hypothetical protein RIB71_20260, partial [Imperialibacter sp.]|uniref:hypothetical protein n=1 Tax=Imperialibacter sp. TaxID=2038411 RepID=UPI0032EA91C5
MTKAAFFRELDQAYSLFNDNFLQILHLKYDVNKGLDLYKSERKAILEAYEILEGKEHILNHFKAHIERMERSGYFGQTMPPISVYLCHFESAVIWVKNITSAFLFLMILQRGLSCEKS